MNLWSFFVQRCLHILRCGQEQADPVCGAGACGRNCRALLLRKYVKQQLRFAEVSNGWIIS